MEHSKDLPWWVVLGPVTNDLVTRCPEYAARITEVLRVVLLGWPLGQDPVVYSHMHLTNWAALGSCGDLGQLRPEPSLAAKPGGSVWDADLACLSRPWLVAAGEAWKAMVELGSADSFPPLLVDHASDPHSLWRFSSSLPGDAR